MLQVKEEEPFRQRLLTVAVLISSQAGKWKARMPTNQRRCLRDYTVHVCLFWRCVRMGNQRKAWSKTHYHHECFSASATAAAPSPSPTSTVLFGPVNHFLALTR